MEGCEGGKIRNPMNEVYEINVAKARLRDAYNAGNVDLLLMAFADEFTDMSSGKPSFFGADAKSVFRMRMTSLFKQHQATLIVTVMAITQLTHMFPCSILVRNVHYLDLRILGNGRNFSLVARI